MQIVERAIKSDMSECASDSPPVRVCSDPEEYADLIVENIANSCDWARAASALKRPRGRPRKNLPQPEAKRQRGRPPGSKNKPKPEKSEVKQDEQPVKEKRKHAPQTRPAPVAARNCFGAGDEGGEVTLPKGSGEGKVFAYMRRSAEDRRGRPLHAQEETIRAYVRECLEYKLLPSDVNGVREFFMDNGISGTTAPQDRPGMSKLIAAIQSIPRSHVVIYDPTRLARSVDVGTEIRRIFERAGATLHVAQSRMTVEGANQEMMFGINLHMAAAERTAVITRIRTAFKHHPDWDPRRSFGWKFTGRGEAPIPIPEEQETLAFIKELYQSKELLSTLEIAKRVQERTGGRRWRCKDADEVAQRNGTLAKWTGSEILFLARKHKWKWGGDALASTGAKVFTREDLKAEAEREIANGGDLETFLKAKAGYMCDGVKLNRAMLKNYFPEALPAWKREAITHAIPWVRSEKHSIDDIAALLNQEVPLPGGKRWPRQSAWRIYKLASECNEAEQRRISDMELRRRAGEIRSRGRNQEVQ